MTTSYARYFVMAFFRNYPTTNPFNRNRWYTPEDIERWGGGDPPDPKIVEQFRKACERFHEMGLLRRSPHGKFQMTQRQWEGSRRIYHKMLTQNAGRRRKAGTEA